MGRRRTRTRKSKNSVFAMAKRASNKYVPKVESQLENVGSKVVKTVPLFQKFTRKLMGLFKK